MVQIVTNRVLNPCRGISHIDMIDIYKYMHMQTFLRLLIYQAHMNLVRNTAMYQFLIVSGSKTDMLQQHGCQLRHTLPKCHIFIIGTSVLPEVIDKKTFF